MEARIKQLVSAYLCGAFTTDEVYRCLVREFNMDELEAKAAVQRALAE